MSEIFKKLYVVEINEPPPNSVWYSNKRGEHFEVEIKPRGERGLVGFYIGGGRFINPVHAKIISEKKINI